jgi:hypothetical protein
MASRKLGAALAATVLAWVLALPLPASAGAATTPAAEQGGAFTALTATAEPAPPVGGSSTSGSSPESQAESEPVAPAAVKAATTTKVSESQAHVDYGNEAAVQFTVEVSGGSPSGETAEVTVGTGAATAVCSAHLAAGVGKCSLANAALPASSAVYAVSASYPGDASLEASSGSAAAGLTVVGGRSATKVSESATHVAFEHESAIEFTVEVTAEGNVELPAEGAAATVHVGTAACTASLAGGTVSKGRCTIANASALKPGSYAVSAEYEGDANLSPSSSTNSLSLLVEGNALAPFRITLGGSELAAKITYGATATLAEAGLPAEAHGTVRFSSGSSTLCQFTAPAASSCATAVLAAGSYPSIAATFTPEVGNAYGGSTSTNTLSLTVSPAVTAFKLKVDASEAPEAIVYGSSATLGQTGLPGGAAGRIRFQAGASTLCELEVPGAGSCSTGVLAAGTYGPITATYVPASPSNYAGSSATNSPSLTVERAPTSFTVLVDGSESPAAIAYGAVAQLEQSGLPAQAQGTVTFSAGTTVLCSFTLPAAAGAGSCSQALPAGTYTAITATFTATGGNYASSASTRTSALKVQPAASPFTTTVNGAAAAVTRYGSSATLAVQGLPAGARGSIAFSSGGTALCSVQAGEGSSCTTAADLSPGSYAPITATFTDTDGNYAGATATDTLQLTVERLASAVSITSSPSPATPFTPLTLIATVTGGPVNGHAPTGQVTFKSGEHTLGVGTVDPLGVATLATAAPAPGSYYAGASYEGDGLFAGSQSPVVIQSVKETYAGLFGLTASYVTGSSGYGRLKAAGRTAIDGQLTEIERLLTLAGAKPAKAVLAATIYDADVMVEESEKLLSVIQAASLIKLSDGLPAPKIVAVSSPGHTLKGHAVAVGTITAGEAELTLRHVHNPHGKTYTLLIRTRAHGRFKTLLSRTLTIA